MTKRIALDTGAARALCYEEPEWISSFVKMKNEEWTFHLSDIAVAELIAAFERGAITIEQWSDLISRLDTFISDWLPCLPGKRQLFHLCDFEDREDTNKEKDTSNFREAYSKAVWLTLRQMALPQCEQKEIIFEADGKEFKCPLKPSTAESELETERNKWIGEMTRQPKENFDYTNEVAKIKADFDSWASTSGLPMSIRGDILAHAQAEWEKRLASGYSACSKKRRNDGIDFLLNFSFMWPSLMLTTDCAVYKFLRSLPSYQAGWIYKPEELAKAWESKSLAEPIWP